MDRLNIAHLKILRDLAQTGSVSRAAELNDVSQSAASQSLKTLEKHFGVALVDRGARPVKMTPEGRVCVEAARDVLRRCEELEAQLAALQAQLSGVVRVASIYSIGIYEMAQLREEFEQRHPKTRIQLDYLRPDKIYEEIETDQADLGLVSYPQATREIQAIEWRRERMVLVCHPSDPLAARRSARPRDLARKDFISFDPGLRIRRALDRFFREHGVQREVALEFDNIQMIKEALRAGQGVSILPERTVRQERAEGKLVALPIEAEGLVRPVGIIFLRKKKFSPPMAAFLEFLRRSAEPEANAA